jgi:hypothetical protein
MFNAMKKAAKAPRRVNAPKSIDMPMKSSVARVM